MFVVYQIRAFTLGGMLSQGCLNSWMNRNDHPDRANNTNWCIFKNKVLWWFVSIVSYRRYSPFGIMCLIAGKIMELPDLAKTAEQLGMYMVTVITGLVIHTFCTLCVLYAVITRKNPARFFQGMLQAWITALGTASRYRNFPSYFQLMIN